MSIAGTLFVKALAIHQALYQRTDGRVGHKLLGVPTLLLSTVGRKTGKHRVNALTYATVPDGYAVVASNGGAARDPGWLHNIIANPTATVQIGREKFPARGRVLRPDDEGYREAWDAANKINRDRYSTYQKMTTRPIPVVVLSRAAT